MEKLKIQHSKTLKALETLKECLNDYQKALQQHTSLPYTTAEKLERYMRDSLIQRFEYCTDLFWKLLKDYLEYNVKQLPEIIGSSHIFRAASQAKLISEAEATQAIEMVKDRRLIAHIYQEKTAVTLSKNAPKYYELMHSIVNRLEP